MHLCIQHQFVHGVCFSIFCWTAINNHLPTLLQEEKEKKEKKKGRGFKWLLEDGKEEEC